MADKSQKQPENILGKYFVHTNCIDCDVSRQTAPNNFTQQAEKGYSYFYKQPTTPAEEAQCKEALESCPVEAIGSDGV